MSLYNDLNEVLAPYANKIKEVNESLGAINTISFGDVVDGYYRWDSGRFQSSTTDKSRNVKLPCEEGDSFIYKGELPLGQSAQCILYNGNTFVTSYRNWGTQEAEITIPSGVTHVLFQVKDTATDYYVMRTNPTSSDYAIHLLEKTQGEVDDVYSATTDDLDSFVTIKNVSDGKVSEWGREKRTVNLDDFINSEPKNIIDWRTCTRGNLKFDTGVVSAGSNYITDFIPVEREFPYKAGNTNYFSYYDANKEYLNWGSISSTYGTFITDPQRVYMRTSFTEQQKETAFLCHMRDYDSSGVNGYTYKNITDTGSNFVERSFNQIGSAGSDAIIHGKNLFDYKNDDFVGYNISGDDGSVSYKKNFDNGIVVAANEYIGIPKFIPVESGQVLHCNKLTWPGAYYDANKNYLGKLTGMTDTLGFIVPEGCAYVRLIIQGTNATPTPSNKIGSVEDMKDLMIWVTESQQTKNPIPRYIDVPYKLDGRMLSDNYFDTVVPSMNDSEFLSAMKCMVIREMNKRDHAYRFATFNMTVSVGLNGWDIIRRMLMDCGADFCGFNELTHQGNNDITEFLKGWQFPYGFNDISDEGTFSRKAFASRYEVISGERLMCPSATSNQEYLVCKVRLPRYLDVYNPFRILSVYVIHFPITSADNKVEVANDILAKIATDTSDFIVIMGDTNDFSDLESGKVFWRTFEASGFRPTIPIDTKTVTQDNIGTDSDEYPEKRWRHHSIDQFLVSDNIEVVSYNVINTKDAYNDPPCLVNGATDNLPALSDHDFVYVDLKLNYDTPRSGLSE